MLRELFMLRFASVPIFALDETLCSGDVCGAKILEYCA